jgi:hypothetical protein
VAEAVRTIGMTQETSYLWRSEYGGLKGNRRAVSDLTIEKLILKEAASGNW